ncbi:MAG: hypothetical protein HXY48_13125 [Ignavibacteriaceae bacterium]|nr:hypothetical protein [Ignavibacteriaceae bacterium]
MKNLTTGKEYNIHLLFGYINNYLINPIKSGTIGFVTFFIVLLFSKVVALAFQMSKEFTIDSGDIQLCLMGFAMVFIVKFLDNIKK